MSVKLLKPFQMPDKSHKGVQEKVQPVWPSQRTRVDEESMEVVLIAQWLK
jgi:hypothetical protein